MKSRIAAAVLVAFTGTSTFAAPASGGRASGRSGGGHSSGGHAVARGSSGGHSGGGASSRGASSGGYAHSSSAGYSSRYTGAEQRHPRAGYGTGSRYGYNSGYHGHGHYGHGYYGRGHGYYGYGSYGYYPYYGGYSYPYWGYGGVSVGLYYNNSYPTPAPYAYGYPAEDSYSGAPAAAPEVYAPSEPGPSESRPETGALRLTVRPDDASVYVDGEFRGVALRVGTLRLAPGRHHVEVVRPGFSVADRVVDVRLDAAVSLEVDLARP